MRMLEVSGALGSFADDDVRFVVVGAIIVEVDRFIFKALNNLKLITEMVFKTTFFTFLFF